MSFGQQQNIIDKFESILSSDVMQSYSEMSDVMQSRGIKPGSFRYADDQCIDQNLSQLNSTSGGIWTRTRLGPITMCTHPSLNQVIWSYKIPKNSIGVQLHPVKTKIDASINDRMDRFEDGDGRMYKGEELALGDETNLNFLSFWLGYHNASLICNQWDLCFQGNNSGFSSGNSNAEQSIISSHSLSDSITKHSLSITNIEELCEKGSPGAGTIINVPLSAIAESQDYAYPIPEDITISGVIDLNIMSPLFSSYPTMTQGFSQLFIRWTMNNFLQNLTKCSLNKSAYSNYMGYQFTPPEKPDPIYLVAGDGTLKSYLFRLIRMDSLDNTTHNPRSPISTMPGVQFTEFFTRQLCFELEDQDIIEKMFREKGTFYQPTKVLRTIKFNQINRGVSISQLQTQMSAANIDKIFVTFTFRNEMPTFLPTPTLLEINPMFRGASLLPSADRALNKQTIFKIANCFVDTDLVSPSANLFESLAFKNVDKNESTPEGNYGTINLFSKPGALFTTGIGIPTYFPNLFIYAYDACGVGGFMRGLNSTLGSYDPTSNFQIQLKDSQAGGGDGISTMGDTRDQTSWDSFINTSNWGTLYDSNATSSVTVLCDTILKFDFDQFGNVSRVQTMDHLPPNP